MTLLNFISTIFQSKICKNIYLIFSLLILITRPVKSQVNFKSVDSFAITVGKADSLTIPQLSTRLTSRFDQDSLKARAIFAWIANNIVYDCPAYHIESKRKGKAEEVFKYRKAVCNGYSNLFLEMCSYAGIQCLTIDGYARFSEEDIGQDLSTPNHTWNAVRINNEWKLVDVTWASGYVDKKIRSFTKLYSDIYFFTDPQQFLFSHYPVVHSWKLTKSSFSKKDFINGPLIKYGYFLNNIASYAPKSGIIKSQTNKSLYHSLDVANPVEIRSVIITLGEGKKQIIYRPDFIVSGTSISYEIKCEKPGVYPMTVFVNETACLQYKLVIE